MGVPLWAENHFSLGTSKILCGFEWPQGWALQNSSSLEFFQLLECACPFFPSDLGSFQPLSPQISFLPLSLSLLPLGFPWHISCSTWWCPASPLGFFTFLCFILFPFSWLIILNILSLSSWLLSSPFSSLMVNCFTEFFSPVILFFSSRIFICFFFSGSVPLLISRFAYASASFCVVF